MGKPQNIATKAAQGHDGILPPGFDLDEISDFFSDSHGLSGSVFKELEKALGKTSAKSFGLGVAEAARSFKPPANDEPEGKQGSEPDEVVGDYSFVGYAMTTEEDMLSHSHGHSHVDDHICDGNCGDDCPHAGMHDQEESEPDHTIDLDGFAQARGGKKSGNDPDSGIGGGKGKGKKFQDPEQDQPVAEEPPAEQDPVTEEPVLEEPAVEEPAAEEPPAEEDPVVEEPVLEEPASEPAPEEPAPAPAPQGEFGWVDEFTYVSGSDTPDGFNVKLKFMSSDWTTAQKEAAALQAELLSDYITGDLPANGSIDDVVIQMDLWSYDGAGGVWGFGGVNSVGNDGIADVGTVYLDPNDLGTAESWGMLDELMMHEMLHAIGFGTNWDGLTSGNTFVGENAMQVYGGAVPLDGNGHLSETVGNEMGTTYITNNAEDFSDLTLAILEDMGFETIYDVPVEEEEDPDAFLFV